jgi:predicted anti-sigma-YlaC factor YlaD
MHAYESTTVEMPHQEYGTCALIQDLLPLYLEGEVSPGSRDTIVEHLARCERCASYMAGAQSVRAQLGRERAQRVDVVARDQPARQTVLSGRRLAMMIATLALCALGGVASVLVWSGLTELVGPTALPVGMIMGSVSFAILAMLAQRGAPFSFGRLVPIGAVCGLGAFAAVQMAMSNNSAIKLLGMVLAVAAVAGAWLAIVPERTETPT